MQDTNDKKNVILNQIIELIQQNFVKEKIKLLTSFADRYFSNVSYEDLVERGTDNLYAILVSHWNLIFERKKAESKINIYNPTIAEQGWSSPHTVIEISHDDMPYLVDSIRTEINRCGFLIHLTIHLGGIHVERNRQNEIIRIYPKNDYPEDSLTEAPIYVEIDRQFDSAVLKSLETNLYRILNDVSMVIEDLPKIKIKLHESMVDLEKAKMFLQDNELIEDKSYFQWLENNNFIFLGCRDYLLVDTEKGKALESVLETGLGILRENGRISIRYLNELPEKAQQMITSNQALIFSKTRTLSTIYRSAYTDYIGVKQFDKKGNVMGERRFIGLYTVTASNTTPLEIPYLRQKIAQVIKNSDLPSNSYSSRTLLHILEMLPRDDLFQTDSADLLNLAKEILYLQDKQRIRLLVQQESFGRFFSCLVFIPTNNFTSELCEKFKLILKRGFEAHEVSYNILLSESMLVCVHYIVRTDILGKNNFSFPEEKVKNIEQELVFVGRSWTDKLRLTLIEKYGEMEGNSIFSKYSTSFPMSYRDEVFSAEATKDIEYLEKLSIDHSLEMDFYQSKNKKNYFYFKVFQLDNNIPLSDVLPILENMGVRVMGELPHQVMLKSGKTVWINNFEVVYLGENLDLSQVSENFKHGFESIWRGLLENDNFNQLIITAGFNAYQANVLRAYAKYSRQLGSKFSDAYIAETLVGHIEITRYLIELFESKFNLTQKMQDLDGIVKKILGAFDKIVRLDQDRIFRRYLELIQATMRTNYFQVEKEGERKLCLSFKIHTSLIQDTPLPKPMAEIYVYSPLFEGIHLRGGKVSRGGIRWSDRPEDFRTEVLDLMSTQNVKNACIVPAGAKGGFVPKCIPKNATRDEIMQAGIKCYRLFIRSLLEITDNLKAGNIIPPDNVIRYDEDDPYLVVAADKGTASFSDIANEISMSYDFWLKDAFASGGSVGYDHKKMGITSRGVWESVKRHFHELGRDVINSAFTAIGIGDMSGDVFGNGMLLSQNIKLVAAFNHAHIFIDPNPDVAKSFKERQRLFQLSRSGWEDYDKNLISSGGGIFSRADKIIKLTLEMKELLKISNDMVIPSELIRAILKMEVDLLWNGGIGTFVKASSQIEAEIADRANESLRINANQLRCKVVAEGGNLGFTQLARVEYALNNGKIYTDFIDNSAGVDCSDHEVNIKILLNEIVDKQELTLTARNELLVSMTGEVAKLVLRNNYEQARALSFLAAKSPENLELYTNYMHYLAEQGKLNLDLEFLPTQKILMERKASGKGLMLPELAVIFSYSKQTLKADILASDVPEDIFLSKMIQREFPQALYEKYQLQMKNHILRREIIATQLTNMIINELGFAFIPRLQEETGACVANVVRAFMIVYKVFAKQTLWQDIESLEGKVDVKDQFKMMRVSNRLARHTTRWLLRHRIDNLDIDANVTYFSASISQLSEQLISCLPEETKNSYQEKIDFFTKKTIPEKISKKIVTSLYMFSAFDIVDIVLTYQWNLADVAKTYHLLGLRLHLDWFRLQVIDLYPVNNWDALLRTSLRDDLDVWQKNLVISVLQYQQDQSTVQLDAWMQKNERALSRWNEMVTRLKATTSLEQGMFSVLMRELADLAHACHRSI
jgi:glutamate dehydrogenase